MSPLVYIQVYDVITIGFDPTTLTVESTSKLLMVLDKRSRKKEERKNELPNFHTKAFNFVDWSKFAFCFASVIILWILFKHSSKPIS